MAATPKQQSGKKINAPITRTTLIWLQEQPKCGYSTGKSSTAKSLMFSRCSA